MPFNTLLFIASLTIKSKNEVSWTDGQDLNLRPEYMEYPRIPNSELKGQFERYVDNHPLEETSFREWIYRNCPDCRMIHQMLLDSCDDIRLSSIWKKARDLEDRHNTETHITAPPKRTHKGNGTHNGIWAGTLTMSPNDHTNENEMVHAMTKIFSQQTCPVKRYVWYVEQTDNGMPHIHFIYETDAGGRIHQKVFKRYWKIWDESQKIGRGHRGGYHKPVESETAYLEYIEKDSGRHINKWTT